MPRKPEGLLPNLLASLRDGPVAVVGSSGPRGAEAYCIIKEPDQPAALVLEVSANKGWLGRQPGVGIDVTPGEYGYPEVWARASGGQAKVVSATDASPRDQKFILAKPARQAVERNYRSGNEAVNVVNNTEVNRMLREAVDGRRPSKDIVPNNTYRVEGKGRKGLSWFHSVAPCIDPNSLPAPEAADLRAAAGDGPSWSQEMAAVEASMSSRIGSCRGGKIPAANKKWL